MRLLKILTTVKHLTDMIVIPDFIKLGPYEKPAERSADWASGETFVEFVHEDYVKPDTGAVELILVDGEATNMRLLGWSVWEDKKVEISVDGIEELSKTHKVEVLWKKVLKTPE